MFKTNQQRKETMPNINDNEMTSAVIKYKENMVSDYKNWTLGTFNKNTNLREHLEDSVLGKRISDFDKGIKVEKTPLYWKVINTDVNGSSRSVHSFIVRNDKNIRGHERKRGDILKAASWSSPAHNFNRGNILSDSYKVFWVGTI